jgi:hypothetical protein
MCEIMMNKIEPTINSQHLSYFTEYLEDVSEKSPRKYDKKIEKTQAFDPALKINTSLDSGS